MIHENRSYVCAFPGAGVEFCGMEAKLLRNHTDRFEKLAVRMHNRTGVSIDALSYIPVQKLPELHQHYITYFYSCVLWDTIKDAMRTVMVAGYSLGVYAALYAAGVYSFEQGLQIICEAHNAMSRIVSGGDFGMLVIVGLSQRECLGITQAYTPHEVLPVNQNNETGFVLSGRRKQLRECAEAAERLGAYKTVMLNISIPYHHPLLRDASEEVLSRIANLPWNRAEIPVISAVDQKTYTAAEQLKKLVAYNFATPINWFKVIQSIRGECSGVIECGPGISLTQMGRFIYPPVPYVNIKTVKRHLSV